MYQLKRRIIDVKDNEEEETLEETCVEYHDLATAIFELGKARKADKALYRLALKKSNYNMIIDDCHDDTSYSFMIHKTCIECELTSTGISIEDEACKLYRLEN